MCRISQQLSHQEKNDVINERKKYIDLNIELRHEIEAKTTLNENRIQKKFVRLIVKKFRK